MQAKGRQERRQRRQIRKKRGNKPKPKPPSPSPPQSSQPLPSQTRPLQASPGPGAPPPSPEPHAVEALTPYDARPSQPGRPPALKATEKSQRTCSERSKKRYRSVLQDESGDGSGSDVEQASTARPPPPLACIVNDDANLMDADECTGLNSDEDPFVVEEPEDEEDTTVMKTGWRIGTSELSRMKTLMRIGWACRALFVRRSLETQGRSL
ncbi:hypothetical protein PC114_g21361 [Phytophthora cactorum]|uniref:Uncharacterized protein n=1 Tax=Phytophthora cactorum TaxID=29920 RepID=A0A8T1BHB8_9STRA|nr:hypothetical protein PC114_g21361 [Phytophthora cactorum]KAG2903777.1 hypothetical protein PC117_g21189 [Phytophthora cactorum]KAG3136123.1 hypothetical protein C6341_g21518 [Phytophthora cactorum]